MIDKKLRDKAIKAYRALKSCDAIVQKQKTEIEDYCENYISSVYPKEIFDLVPTGYLKKQDSICFRYWSQPLKSRPEFITTYFDCWSDLVIDLEKRKLPYLFSEFDSAELKKEHPEFAKELGEKITNFLDTVQGFAQSMKAIEDILTLPNMNLRELKANFSELYKLIKD